MQYVRSKPNLVGHGWKRSVISRDARIGISLHLLALLHRNIGLNLLLWHVARLDSDRLAPRSIGALKADQDDRANASSFQTLVAGM